MRPLWTGALTFGLVNIPVRLHSAVQAKERVSFRLLHKKDLSPIKYERVCQKDGEVVDWKDIVKGYEYTKGKFVVLTDDDFKAAAIESSKTIEIIDFVKAEEIDPRYFETPYYLTPAKGRREGVRAAARGDQADRHGRHRQDHDAHELAAPRGRQSASATRSCSRSCDSPTRSSTPVISTSRATKACDRRSCRWREQLVENLSRSSTRRSTSTTTTRT